MTNPAPVLPAALPRFSRDEVIDRAEALAGWLHLVSGKKWSIRTTLTAPGEVPEDVLPCSAIWVGSPEHPEGPNGRWSGLIGLRVRFNKPLDWDPVA